MFLESIYSHYKVNIILTGIFTLIAFVYLFKNNLQLFWFGLFGALIIIRLPIILYNNELNLDESQMIAGARTLWHDPVYWRSVDGQTIGPLTFYFLGLCKFFSSEITYSGIRFLNLFLTIGDIYLFFLSVRILFTEQVAKISAFFVFLFLAYNNSFDLLHYSSEQLPVFCLNLAAYLTLKYHFQQNNIRLLYCAGLLLGALPFLKIQSVLLAGFVGILGIYYLYQQIHFDSKYRLKYLYLVLSYLFIPLAFAVFIISFDVLGDFWNYYILDNFVYVSSNGNAYHWKESNLIFFSSKDFVVYLSGISFFTLINIRSVIRFAQVHFVQTILFLLVLLLAYLTVLLPKNNFPHYLNFMIYPLCLWMAFVLNTISRVDYKQFLLAFGIFAVWEATQLLVYHQTNFYVYMILNKQMKSTPTGAYIRENTSTNDYLAIWGWDCKLYIETNTLQAVPESHSERCMFPTPQQKVHLERYLRYLKKNKPRFLIDVSSKIDFFIPIHRFKDLNEYLNKYYFLDKTIDGNVIYRLK